MRRLGENKLYYQIYAALLEGDSNLMVSLEDQAQRESCESVGKEEAGC